jgi:catechol 2,3-dioxygenase-like lactoylglutathione lyase family enzyme
VRGVTRAAEARERDASRSRGHVFHVNVNCSDLAASLDFYRGFGLEPTVRTAPEQPQPGDAFALELAQWDAWILAGADGYGAPVLDLLEWQVPKPGRPVDGGGFRAVHLAGAVPARTDTVDPDGTTVIVTPGDRAAVRGVTIACSDVDRAQRFYEAALGLAPAGRGTLADPRGPDVFTVELEPAAGTATPKAANDLGVYRLAFLTAALEADCARLDELGARRYSPPATLDMGPGLPALRAVLFADPDGTTLELIESPAAPGV